MDAAKALAAQGLHLEAEQTYLVAMREVESKPKSRRLFAQSLFELGHLMTLIGSFDEAEGYLLRTLAIREEMHGPVHQDVAATLTALGRIYAPYESEESEKLLKRAISIYQELDQSSIVFPAEHLSTLYLLRGRREERRVLLAELVSRMESSSENELPLLGKSLLMLAQFHEEDNEAEAERLLIRAMPFLCADDAYAQSAAEAGLLLAKIQMRKQNFAEAEKNFKLALERADMVASTSAHTTVEILTKLARLYAIAYKKYESAEQLLSRATAICQSQNPPLPTHNLILEYEKLCEFTGHYDSLEKLRKDLLEAYKSIIDEARDRCETGERTAYASTESCNISRLLRQQKRLDEAAPFAEWAVETDEAGNSAKLVASLIELANVRFEQNDIDQASALCDRILQLKFDQNWYFPQLTDALRLMLLLGRTSDASQLKRIAKEFIQKFANNHEWCKGLCHRLSLVYLEVGERDEADQLIERALREAEQAEPANTLFFAYLLESWAAQFRLIGGEELASQYDKRAAEIRQTAGVAASSPAAR
jgi:tetratricopeptide (TPR) repeat protein